MTAETEEYPGRYLVERRCSEADRPGTPVAASPMLEGAIHFAEARADYDHHVYWIRDRWMPRNERPELTQRREGRVVWMVFPVESTGWTKRFRESTE